MENPIQQKDEEAGQKDDDSVISERCWEEKYRGDSRKWLMRDGSRKELYYPLTSTMKSCYGYPVQEEIPVGIRRASLKKRLYDETTQEIMQEMKEPPPVVEYCTEYDGNFSVPGFVPEKIPERNEELNNKYPLYQSKPASFWQFQFDKNNKDAFTIPGFSAVSDFNNPFRRNSRFSKPLDEALEGSDAL